MLISPLYEGTFSVGLDKKFNPMGRTDKPAKGALRISIQPFVVQDDERTMLFDAGIGEFGEGTSIQTLLNNLSELDIEEYEISDIFISHLHFDHLGGLAHRMNGFWELTFPDATVHINRQEWEKVMEQDEFYDEEKTDFINFVAAKAEINLLELEDKPISRITSERIGGHTEFHLAYTYKHGDEGFIMAGDVLPTKGHVNQKFAAKYDFDPKQSVESRQMLAKRAFEEKLFILAYHSSEAGVLKLTDYTDDGYTIEDMGVYRSG